METSEKHGTNYTQTLIHWVARARQVGGYQIKYPAISLILTNQEGRGCTGMVVNANNQGVCCMVFETLKEKNLG